MGEIALHNVNAAHPKSQWVTLAALGAAVMSCALEISMLFPSLPAIIREFGDPAAVFWTVTIHYLTAASSVALAGRLGDLFGRKRVLVVVLALSVCGSLLSFASSTLLGVVIGRGIQGLSAAAIPLSFGLVRQALPPERVPFGVGIVASVAPVVGGIGALIGGMLVDHASWRLLFAVSAVVAACTIALVFWALPQGAPGARKHIDILGGVLVPPAIAALLLAIHFARSWGWVDPRTLGLCAAGLAVLAFWYRYESRHADPLIDVRLLSRRQIGVANLGMALFGLGALQNNQIFSILLQQPTWTGAGFGVTATQTGLLFVPFILINLIGGPLSGRLATRYGGRLPAILGMCLTAIGWTALSMQHSELWFVMAMAYTQCLGIAMLFAALPNLVVEDAPGDRTSEATGVLSVVRQIAASIGTQVIGYTLATSTISDSTVSAAKYPTEAAFTLTLAFVAGVCVASVLVASMLPKRRPLVAAPRPSSAR
jgi:MFS family permease